MCATNANHRERRAIYPVGDYHYTVGNRSEGGAPVDEHVGAGDGVVHGQPRLEPQRVGVRRQLRALQQDGPDL